MILLAARDAFRPISSVVSDFTFTTSDAPVALIRRVMIVFAEAASGAQWTTPPARTTSPRAPRGVHPGGARRVLDAPAGLAELLPIVQLGNRVGALVADRVCSHAQVMTQLGVANCASPRRPGRGSSLLAGEDFCDVHRPHTRPPARKPPADVKRAGTVNGCAHLRTGVEDGPDFVGEHRC